MSGAATDQGGALPQDAYSASNNDVTITVGGMRIGGWEAVRITRGVERMPPDFDIILTERYPSQPTESIVKPGMPCVVKIGGDVVITGYVDRYMPSIEPHQHQVRIMGRGKGQDLVDCAAGITPDGIGPMQLAAMPTLDIAQRLAKPFGITVTSKAGSGKQIQQININLGETPWDLIERVTRYSQLLAYEGTDGNLILAQAASEKMASGFDEGVNVQRAEPIYSMDQRYSVYYGALISFNSFMQIDGPDGNTFLAAKDPNVPRFRPMVVVSEQFQDGTSLAQARAVWEMTRRWGRSQAVRVTVDSWRDSAGKLWTPNALAYVGLPSLKLVPTDPLVIAEVTFLRDPETGTTAEVVLMPKDAFSPEPTLVQPQFWQIGQALQEGGAAPGPAGGAP